MSLLLKLPTLPSTLSNNLNKTMVTTRSATRARSRLAELPTELLLQIFQSAPSFQAASRLARTSKQFQSIWIQHLTPICESIAPSCILEHDALRDCLIDLGHISADTTTITVGYAAVIVEGSKIGDTLVDAYHRRMEAQAYHDPQVPATLSPTEKRRYVRGTYQLMGLLSLDTKKQEERITKVFTLKDLFLLSDFLCVFMAHAIVDERLREILDSDPHIPYVLQRNLRWERNKRFRELYGHRYRPIQDTPYEQNGRHAWWCDRQQTTFCELLTGRVYRDEDGKIDLSKVRDDLWYDSGEE
ncbi:hypothetical protein BDV06DRAFT_202206 [Aspergillus oleicola]